MADHYAGDKTVGATAGDNGLPAQGLHESHNPQEMTAGEYARTRLSTLKPPLHKAPNPITLLRMLTGKQWLFFAVGFIGWVS